MAIKHGRHGRVMLGASTSGAAVAVPGLSSWSIDFSTDQADVTAFGDENKVYVAGLPDASGQFGGFLDVAGQALLSGARDGLSRRMYLYPDSDTATEYWYGTVLVDFSSEGAVDGANKVSCKWKAAGTITPIGIT